MRKTVVQTIYTDDIIIIQCNITTEEYGKYVYIFIKMVKSVERERERERFLRASEFRLSIMLCYITSCGYTITLSSCAHNGCVMFFSLLLLLPSAVVANDEPTLALFPAKQTRKKKNSFVSTWSYCNHYSCELHYMY